MTTPSAFAPSQVIGVVDSVSPRELVVRLEHQAPQATSLNAGHVQRFPRINGWVLVPSEIGYLVGSVTWVGVDKARDLNEAESSTRGVVNLPFPARRMHVTPLGTLRWRDGDEGAELVRGILSYPSVGEPVLVPTAEQLRAIAQATETNARLRLGTSPLAGDVEVRVDPDRLFGRHLAVLGNTGSGKSCTVAGLVRWSLEAAARELPITDSPHARFIILDPNGEYAECFKDLSAVRVLRPQPDESLGEQQLTVPGWLWNTSEWAAITRAAPQTQRPLLQQALRNLRSALEPDASTEQMLAIHVRGYLSIWEAFRVDPKSYTNFPQRNTVKQVVDGMLPLIRGYRDDLGLDGLGEVVEHLETLEAAQAGYGRAYYPLEVQELIDLLRAVEPNLPTGTTLAFSSEDAPAEFELSTLPDHLQALSRTGDFASGASHSSFLIARIRTMLGDLRLRDVIAPSDGPDLAEWLCDVIGAEDSSNGQIVVIDLSLLASEVVHTVVAVLGRAVMEALQHVRRTCGQELPTVLVLEEAHTFVSSRLSPADIPTTADLCRQTFERISREGRKFGLGLVVSSQRPSELSQTVLSQCNTFMLHRLVNDRDQDLVGRMIPDSLGDLLKELPSLPSRQAILLGWATPIPTLVEVSELAPEQRPSSSDPHFWATWTREKPVSFSWSQAIDRWIDPTGSLATKPATGPSAPEVDPEPPPF